jgi:hypothetical protein
MDRFPVELLYVLAFVGFILFNVIAQRAARRRQQEEAAQAPAEPPPAADEPLEDVWGRIPAAVQAPVVAPRPAPPPVREAPRAPRRLHPARALLKNKHDLRRAVVLMMVLGPCRAQEPPDSSRP